MFNIYDIFLCVTTPIFIFVTARLVDLHSLFGQLPGAESAIKAAAETNRWEAVALSVIMLAVTGFLVYVVKKLMDQALVREANLSARINDLENYIRTTLMDVVRDNTKVTAALIVSNESNVNIIKELIASLHSTRPCFMSSEQQDKTIDSMGRKIIDYVQLKVDKK
jgi:DICT domain-containing protein